MWGRITFGGVILFWLTMNILLWRLEYGARGGDTQVPAELVWRKILTAPDPSSLSVYQNGERMGYCEFSTGVGQQMATFDEGKPPPEGFVARSDYQLHVAGNVSLGDFTNRLKFEARLRLNHAHEWSELFLRVTSRTAVLEVSSLSTNGTVHIKMSSEGALVLEREIQLSELQNPGSVARLLTGNAVGDFLGMFDPTDMLPGAQAQPIEWEARRTRVKIGSESVPVYSLETMILGHPVTVDVSTLGEILRIDLPDKISARIDEWNKP